MHPREGSTLADRGRRPLASAGKYPTLRNLAAFGGSNSLAQLIMMVYAILAARIMGPSGYGAFAGTYAVAGLGASVLSWGMDSYLLREAGLSGETAKLSGAVLKAKGSLGTLLILGLTIALPLARPDTFSSSLAAICALDMVLDTSFNTVIYGLNVQGRSRDILVLLLSSRGGRLLGLLVLIPLAQAGPLQVAGTRCLATCAALAAGLFLLQPDLSRQNPLVAREVLTSSSPFGISEVLSLVYTNADVALLSLMAEKDAVGLYSPATGMVHALFVIPNSAYVALLPRLSSLAREGGVSFQKASQKAFIGFSLMGIAMWTCVRLGSGLIVHVLFGQPFAQTARVLDIVSSILFIKSVEFALILVLVSVGWQKERLGPQTVAALLTLVDLWVIPRFGIEGAAWVYVASEAVLVVGYTGLVLEQRRILRFRNAVK